MKKFLVIAGLLLLAASAGVILFWKQPPVPASLPSSATMKFESSAFENGSPIPSEFTCDGGSRRPPLRFSGIPGGAKSLAIIIHDPDAVRGDFTHWTVWNLPPSTEEIGAAGLPAGAVEGKTGTGKPGYVGPCPPSGIHRYFFEAYALDAMLNLPPAAGESELRAAMDGRILDKAGLLGTYHRK